MITDAGLAHVGAIRMLESLMIMEAPISDDGLAHLDNLNALKMLTLRNTKVTDEGVARLRLALPGLAHVSIGGLGVRPLFPPRKAIGFTTDTVTGSKNAHLQTRLTAADVEELKQVRNLGTLFLSRDTKDEDLLLVADLPITGLVINSKNVTDEGVKALQDHPTMESLGLWSSSITDRSLESIPRIRSLTKLTIQKAPITDEGVLRLGLSGTKVTDSAMVHVGKLTELEWLWLDETDVGDEGIRQLDRLLKLQYLYVNAANISKEGHLRLRRVHPSANFLLQ